jgi:galactosamine-6-phosphate isomerase
MLKPQIFADHEAVSQRAVQWLVERLTERPDALLCLATGSTPMRTYELLAVRVKNDPRLVERVRILNLDDWGGLPANHPASCERHLRDALIAPLRLNDRFASFDNQASDPDAECARIARWLDKNGPIDACLLGLGLNGHLGFNEPADALQPHAHVAQLSEASLSHAMVQMAGLRPTHGLTLGMADLLHSRHVMLLVTGERKREPLARLLSGEITTRFPASLLALHPIVQVLCDDAACSNA